MTPAVLSRAKPGAILMHPLPRKARDGNAGRPRRSSTPTPAASTSTRCRTACTSAWRWSQASSARACERSCELRGPVDLHVHLRDLDWSHKATVRLGDRGRPGGWLLGGHGHAQHPAADDHPRAAASQEGTTGRGRLLRLRDVVRRGRRGPVRCGRPHRRRGALRRRAEDVLRPDDGGPAGLGHRHAASAPPGVEPGVAAAGRGPRRGPDARRGRAARAGDRGARPFLPRERAGRDRRPPSGQGRGPADQRRSHATSPVPDRPRMRNAWAATAACDRP